MRISSAAQGLALGLFMFTIAPAVSSAQIGIGISIRIGPPALPVYVQPPCPTDGYLWVPGYWAYGPDGYYWVPGVWVAPPRPGLLWTPGYWGFGGGVYGWHAGYWGPHVGFYGGVNYGFGYSGVGFGGGVWAGNVFRYNTAVVNVNRTVIRNVYVDRTVINNTTVVNRASFNGPGGVNVRPSPQEQAAMHEPHMQPTANQISHEQVARSDRAQLASVNGGRPAAAAMDRVGGQRFGAQGRQGGEAPARANAAPNAGQGPGQRPNAMQANRPAPAARAEAVRPQAQQNRPNAERPAAQRPAAQHPSERPAERPAAQHQQARPQQHEEPHGEHKPPR